jgi:hypothetical protein
MLGLNIFEIWGAPPHPLPLPPAGGKGACWYTASNIFYANIFFSVHILHFFTQTCTTFLHKHAHFYTNVFCTAHFYTNTFLNMHIIYTNIFSSTFFTLHIFYTAHYLHKTFFPAHFLHCTFFTQTFFFQYILHKRFLDIFTQTLLHKHFDHALHKYYHFDHTLSTLFIKNKHNDS